MKKRRAGIGPWAPRALLFWLAVALCSCGGGETIGPPALVVRLEIPAGPDPFEGMVSLRLVASSPSLPSVEKEIGRNTPVLELSELRYGERWQLLLEGTNAGGDAVARGSSAPFDLTPESPREVRVLFYALERFSLGSARLSQPRYGHSATLLPDASVLVIGGFDERGRPLTSVERYEPISDSFESKPPLASARGGHQALLLGNGRIAVVGGSDGTDPVPTVEIYTWATGSTAEVTLATTRERPFAAALSDDTVLVAGGLDGNKPADTTELIDPIEATRDDGPAGGPDQYGGVAFTLSDGRVVAAGGLTGPPVGHGPGSWIFDGSAWQSGPALARGADGAQVAITESNQVVVVGGEGAERVVQTFSTGPDEFAEAGSTTAAFVDHAVAALGERVVIAGGSRGSAVEIWRGGVVQEAGSLLRARSNFTLTTLRDGRVVAIGGRVAGTATDEIELFIPR